MAEADAASATDAEKLQKELDRMERLSKEIASLMPSRQHVNNSSFNINAGGIYTAIAIFFLGICTAVSTTLYIADRLDRAKDMTFLQAELDDAKATQRTDQERTEENLKDLRDNQTTEQAYLNQLFRDKTK